LVAVDEMRLVEYQFVSDQVQFCLTAQIPDR